MAANPACLDLQSCREVREDQSKCMFGHVAQHNVWRKSNLNTVQHGRVWLMMWAKNNILHGVGLQSLAFAVVGYVVCRTAFCETTSHRMRRIVTSDGNPGMCQDSAREMRLT
ncbi:hypothetical protein XENOCAPTIV_018534 [Xenoophorus captivus]|uniref:Uncharacterized protein n=1 Tax=Xenoophorus captivus TaxID=1517983 RepID=A0ABV0RTB4_9TELE